MAQTATRDITLGGWDTMFAVRLADVARSMARRGTIPRTLDVKAGSATPAVKAVFGDWTIVPGKDSDHVAMILPMTNLSATFGSGDDARTTTSAKCQVVISLRLDIVDRPDLRSAPDGTAIAAPVAATKRQAVTVRLGDEPPASFAKFSASAPLDDPTDGYPIGEAIATWFSASFATLDPVFAVIDAATKPATGPWAFCTPLVSTCAIVRTEDQASSTLAVMSITNPATPVPDGGEVPPDVIPDGMDAAFLVRPERWFLDMLVPTLGKVFPGLDHSDLVVAADGKTVTMRQGARVPLRAKSDPRVDFRNPAMLGFLARIEKTKIVIETYTEAEIWELDIFTGVYATNRSTYNYAVEVTRDANGKAAPQYRELGNPIHQKGHRTTTFVSTLEAILPFVTIVVSLLVMATDGAAAALLLLLLLILAVGKYEVELAKDKADTVVPTLDNLSRTFCGPTMWRGSPLNVVAGDLHGALRLSGVWA